MNDVPPAYIFAPDRALGVLHRNFPLRLRDRNDTRQSHPDQQADSSAIPWPKLNLASNAAAGKNMSLSACTACGSRARMPMVMTSETPLPMPRSVICSPSHISNIVPVVRISTV